MTEFAARYRLSSRGGQDGGTDDTKHTTKAAIGYGIHASRTLRNLVTVMDCSDSTVYLAEGDCGKNRHACFVDVTTAGQHRFLQRIRYRTVKRSS